MWVFRHWNALAKLALVHLSPPQATLHVRKDGHLLVSAPTDVLEHIEVLLGSSNRTLGNAIGHVVSKETGVVLFTLPDDSGELKYEICYVDVLDGRAFPHYVMLHDTVLYATDEEWLKTYTPLLTELGPRTILSYTSPMPEFEHPEVLAGDVLRVVLQVWPEAAAQPWCTLSQPRPVDDSPLWQKPEYRCWQRFSNFSLTDVADSQYLPDKVTDAILAAAAETIDELQLLKIEALLRALHSTGTIGTETWDAAKKRTAAVHDAIPILASYDVPTLQTYVNDLDPQLFSPHCPTERLRQLSTVVGEHNFYITSEQFDREEGAVQLSMRAAARLRGGIKSCHSPREWSIKVNGFSSSLDSVQPFDEICVESLQANENVRVFDKTSGRCIIATRNTFVLTETGFYQVLLPDGSLLDCSAAYNISNIQGWTLTDTDLNDVEQPIKLTGHFCIVPLFKTKVTVRQRKAMRKKIPHGDSLTVHLAWKEDKVQIRAKCINNYTIAFMVPNDFEDNIMRVWSAFLYRTNPEFTVSVSTSSFSTTSTVCMIEQLHTNPRTSFEPSHLHPTLYKKLMDKIHPTLLRRAVSILSKEVQCARCVETPVSGSDVTPLKAARVCELLQDATWEDFETCVLYIPGTKKALESNAETLPYAWLCNDPESNYIGYVRVTVPCVSPGLIFTDPNGTSRSIDLSGSIIRWLNSHNNCMVLNCGLRMFIKDDVEYSVQHQVATWEESKDVQTVQVIETSILKKSFAYFVTASSGLAAWVCKKNLDASKTIFMYNCWKECEDGPNEICAINALNGDEDASTFLFDASGQCAFRAPLAATLYMPSNNDTSAITKEWGAGLRAVDFIQGRITNNVQMFATHTNASSLFVHPQCNNQCEGAFTMQTSFKQERDNNSIMSVFGHVDESMLLWPGNTDNSKFSMILESDAYYKFLTTHLCSNSLSCMSSFSDAEWLTLDTSHVNIDTVHDVESVQEGLHVTCCTTQDIYKITRLQILPNKAVIICLDGVKDTHPFNMLRLNSLPPVTVPLSNATLIMLHCFLGQVPLLCVSLPAFITSMVTFDGHSLYNSTYGTVELPTHLQLSSSTPSLPLSTGSLDVGEAESEPAITPGDLSDVRAGVQRCNTWPDVAETLQQYAVIVKSNTAATLSMLAEEGWPCDDLDVFV